MEWQAGYGCGAVLMPKPSVIAAVITLRRNLGVPGNLVAGTPAALEVQRQVAEQFGASLEAARVRLEVLRMVQPAGMAAQGTLMLGE